MYHHVYPPFLKFKSLLLIGKTANSKSLSHCLLKKSPALAGRKLANDRGHIEQASLLRESEGFTF